MLDSLSGNALVDLVDEVSRTNGRLKSAFAAVRQAVGLGDTELLVLTAVTEADRAPTAAGIGRSLGQPRQIVQRAANALMAAGLIATRANPDHKRAMLLVPTDAGLALKRRADEEAGALVRRLAPGLDMAAMARAAEALRGVRLGLEARLRGSE